MNSLFSMTGFAKVQGQLAGKKVNLEIRSLNSSKGLDISVKGSSFFRPLEYRIRQVITEQLQRGKIDIVLTLESSEDSTLNTPLLRRYYSELESLATEMQASKEGLLAALLRMPEIAGEQPHEFTDTDFSAIDELSRQACLQVRAFRIKEGNTLQQEFLFWLTEIESRLPAIKEADPIRILRIRERLKENLALFIPVDKMDPNRFEQEVLFYIEKLDINEELSRLQMHLNHFREVIHHSDPLKGRKLNFIAQEIGREINTIGSKANDADMQKMVVEMKDVLEKIKEQTNNCL